MKYSNFSLQITPHKMKISESINCAFFLQKLVKFDLQICYKGQLLVIQCLKPNKKVSEKYNLHTSFSPFSFCEAFLATFSIFYFWLAFSRVLWTDLILYWVLIHLCVKRKSKKLQMGRNFHFVRRVFLEENVHAHFSPKYSFWDQIRPREQKYGS